MFESKKHLNWEKIVELHEKDDTFYQYYADIIKNIFLNEANIDKRIFLITSAVESEGKSSLAVNTAAILAKSGEKTLFIDGNSSNPIAEKFFGVKNSLGLLNVLSSNVSKEEIIVQDKCLSNLYLLPSGTAKDNLLNMLVYKKIGILLEELKSSFEYIIIDGSSIDKSLDSLILSGYVDGVILVVQCDRSKKEVILNAKRRIERNKGSIIGAVLNKIPSYIPSYFRRM